MSFKEKDMQTLFTKWMKRNKWDEPAAFELKICKKKSLPYSRIEEHQLYYLNKGEQEGFTYKLSDQSMGMKPWDSMWFMGSGYIVILFYEPRKPKYTYIIKVRDFVNHQANSKRKSITEGECINISYKIIEL